MHTVHDHPKYLDIRLAIYRISKQVVFIFLIGFILKYSVCDTYVVDDVQMEPSVLQGDRVLISKLAYSRLFQTVFHPNLKDVIIFDHPQKKDKKGCLRIAGKPGDCVKIQDGILSLSNNPQVTFTFQKTEESVLPYEFSPRDNMMQYRIPKKNELLLIDTLNIKNLIFLYSIIRQENVEVSYHLYPQLYFNDTLSNEYIIKDFSFYTGKFSAISDTLYSNWFFWDRLLAYLLSIVDEKKVDLKFSILEGNEPVENYRIREDFYFLIAENWHKGFDSRYFGPVIKHFIHGKIIAVLWSFDTHRNGSESFRSRRMGRIIN